MELGNGAELKSLNLETCGVSAGQQRVACFYIEGFSGDESDMICLQHAPAFFVFAWDIEDTFFP